MASFPVVRVATLAGSNKLIHSDRRGRRLFDAPRWAAYVSDRGTASSCRAGGR